MNNYLLFSKKDFPIGTKVKSLSNNDVGEVVETNKNGFKVKWQNYPEDNQFYNYHDIYDGVIPDTPEAQKKVLEHSMQVQAKIDFAASAMEKAFEAWREAKEMMIFDHYTYRENDLIDLSNLDSALVNNGWSSSSLYC